MTKIASPEQVKNYTLDLCPICGGRVTYACRCLLNERTCDNGHHWRRLDDGRAIMCNKNHTDEQPESLEDGMYHVEWIDADTIRLTKPPSPES